MKALDVWLCFCTIHALLHDLTHVFIDITTPPLDELHAAPPPPLFSRIAPSRPATQANRG